MMLRLRVLGGPLKLLVAFLCQGEGKSAFGMCTDLRLQLQVNAIASKCNCNCGIHVLIEMHLSVFALLNAAQAWSIPEDTVPGVFFARLVMEDPPHHWRTDASEIWPSSKFANRDLN